MRKSVSTAWFVASVVAATVAGCGGSVPLTHSSASGRTNTASAHDATAQPSPTKHALLTKYVLSSTRLHAPTKKLHATVYNPSASRKFSGKKAVAGTDASGQTAAPRQNPCTLVTASEASVLLHATVQRETEAPLGPTCILQVKGERQSISFALEEVNVASQIRKMKRKPSHVTIDGHAAYCGRLGAPLLYVKLTGGRALAVTAPCAAARALAARALPRIKA